MLITVVPDLFLVSKLSIVRSNGLSTKGARDRLTAGVLKCLSMRLVRLKSPEGVEDSAAFLDVFDRGESVVDLLMRAFVGDVRLSYWFSS